MKIFHAADLHYCPKHLEWVDRAFSSAVDEAIKRGCDLAVIAGDSFDSTMGIHEPAVTAYVGQIARLAAAMPVVDLYGTLSHDRPGALDILRELRCRHEILVVDKPTRISAHEAPDGSLKLLENGGDEHSLAICAMPSLNKANPSIMDQGAEVWARAQFQTWGAQNIRDRQIGIPSILITHGTVTSSATESDYAMVAPDHEFNLDSLLDAECDAVMLGHIHKHQAWCSSTPKGADCQIAYPGSIARLVFGQRDPVGCLFWTIGEAESAAMEFFELPSRNLIEIAFDGPPDPDELKALSSKMGDEDHVRIRWRVDQEHATGVDKQRIREMFAHVGGLKLEGTVLPVESVRAAGIGRAVTLEDKIKAWADTTGDSAMVPDLLARLDSLRTMDVQEIVEP